MAKRAFLKSLGDVDIRLIRIFVAVTECGGFSASETELNIGRSTISKHICDLETRLGLTLCNRGPSGFSLTAEGQKALVSIRRLLKSIDEFQAEIDDIHQTLTGTLRLGIFDQSTTNPKAHLHQAIRLFDTSVPQVSLEITLDSPSVLEARVLDGSIDIGIVPVHRQSISLSYDMLYDEHMTLYCGEGHPLFEDQSVLTDDIDLSVYKYAGYSFNSPNLKAGQALGLQRSAKVQEEEALSLLIQSGRYIGYLADHVARTLLSKGQVKPIAPNRTGYFSTFAAIIRKQPKPDRRTFEFLSCLRRAHADCG